MNEGQTLKIPRIIRPQRQGFADFLLCQEGGFIAQIRLCQAIVIIPLQAYLRR
jgi:hypothetical protein